MSVFEFPAWSPLSFWMTLKEEGRVNCWPKPLELEMIITKQALLSFEFFFLYLLVVNVLFNSQLRFILRSLVGPFSFILFYKGVIYHVQINSSTLLCNPLALKKKGRKGWGQILALLKQKTLFKKLTLWSDFWKWPQANKPRFFYWWPRWYCLKFKIFGGSKCNYFPEYFLSVLQ